MRKFILILLKENQNFIDNDDDRRSKEFRRR